MMIKTRSSGFLHQFNIPALNHQKGQIIFNKIHRRVHHFLCCKDTCIKIPAYKTHPAQIIASASYFQRYCPKTFLRRDQIMHVLRSVNAGDIVKASRDVERVMRNININRIKTKHLIHDEKINIAGKCFIGEGFIGVFFVGKSHGF